jgi:hypothetical protein
LNGDQSAPEQKDQNDDDHYQAEAPAIVMVRRTNIETASTEKENQNNQEQDQPHRFTPMEGPTRLNGATQCQQ